jgi:hypothetical protein
LVLNFSLPGDEAGNAGNQDRNHQPHSDRNGFYDILKRELVSYHGMQPISLSLPAKPPASKSPSKFDHAFLGYAAGERLYLGMELPAMG